MRFTELGNPNCIRIRRYTRSIRLDEPTEKSNLSGSSLFSYGCTILQQVPVYLTPERASELLQLFRSIGVKNRLWNDGGGVDTRSVAEAAQRQQKPLDEGDDLILPRLPESMTSGFTNGEKLPPPGRSLADYRRTFCEVDPFRRRHISRRPSRVGFTFFSSSPKHWHCSSVDLFKAKRLFGLCSQSSVRVVSVARVAVIEPYRTLRSFFFAEPIFFLLPTVDSPGW